MSEETKQLLILVAGFAMLFSIIAISSCSLDMHESEIKRDAIKAGLYQDRNGNWVKP